MHKLTLTCRTGKRVYQTESIAEDALIDAHSTRQYSGTGPIAVYHCEECGYYHFTSKGKMNERLARQIATGKIKLHQQASAWAHKWKK